MKVCIVTVYNSINSGSYWQAFSLGKYLEKQGCDVVYYKRDNKGTSVSIKSTIIKILSAFIRRGFKGMIDCIESLNGFRKATKAFNIVDSKSINDVDCFILGSDTIWNLKFKYFSDNYRTYFGLVFPEDKRIITYAASSANTSLDNIKEYDEISRAIKRFYKIGVRDIYTKELLLNFTNTDISIVCDPTLLLNKNDYEEYITGKKEFKYIFVYLFKDLTVSQASNIKSFSKKYGLKIVNCIGHYKWCDSYIRNTPENFLNYIFNADYVITDTFHGTIFSVNFNKTFIAIDRGKNKVNDFLERCKLSNRLANTENLSSILIKNIDYSNVNKELNSYYKESSEFLNESLK